MHIPSSFCTKSTLCIAIRRTPVKDEDGRSRAQNSGLYFLPGRELYSSLRSFSFGVELLLYFLVEVLWQRAAEMGRPRTSRFRNQFAGRFSRINFSRAIQ